MTKGRRKKVRQRAGGLCEYCRLPEIASDVPFHVEHVRAKQHGGSENMSNLALAYDRCNLFKGPNLSAVDPLTQEIAFLFHPRGDAWNEHFKLQGAEIVGLTPKGRATVNLLQMNVAKRVQLRAALIETNLFPPT